MVVTKLEIKNKYPRNIQERIERKTRLKESLRFYNNFSRDIVFTPQELVKPVTEDEIRVIRKRKRDKRYYCKNIAKRKAQTEKRYWRMQIGRAKALNEPFKACNAHHISDNYIVYIPRELHQKHQHSLKSYFRMDIINNAVLKWLVSEEKNDIAALMIELLPPELLKPNGIEKHSPYR